MNQLNFNNTINIPTYYSYLGRPSLLDQTWTNLNIKFKSFVIQNPIADHLPTLTIFDIPKIDPIKKKIRFRNYSQNNINHLLQNISLEKQTFLLNKCNCNEIDCMTAEITNWLKQIANKYFPVQTKCLSLNSIKHPWASPIIKKCIKIKHLLF